jgi:hypothetical protein
MKLVYCFAKKAYLSFVENPRVGETARGRQAVASVASRLFIQRNTQR